MDDIVTPRLRLRRMPEGFLEACLCDDLAAAEEIFGVRPPAEWLLDKPLMEMRLNDCRVSAAYRPWSLRAMVDRQTNAMIGHIGFHAAPDAEYLQAFVPTGVEFGYAVFTDFRRQGCAEEAATGLIRWAHRERAVANFVVSIAPSNIASTNLAAKLGFVQIGEHLDEEDGLEHVFLLSGPSLHHLCQEG